MRIENLFKAVEKGNFEAFQALFQPEDATLVHQGETLLHRLVMGVSVHDLKFMEDGYIDIFRILLDNGADSDAKYRAGFDITKVWNYCAEYPDLVCYATSPRRMLAEIDQREGPDVVEQLSYVFETPKVNSTNNQVMAKILLKVLRSHDEARLSDTDRINKLWWAAYNGNFKEFRRLFKPEKDAFVYDRSQGMTLLHAVVLGDTPYRSGNGMSNKEHKYRTIAQILLDSDANPHAAAIQPEEETAWIVKPGDTPLETASQLLRLRGKTAIADLFEDELAVAFHRYSCCERLSDIVTDHAIGLYAGLGAVGFVSFSERASQLSAQKKARDTHGFDLLRDMPLDRKKDKMKMR